MASQAPADGSEAPSVLRRRQSNLASEQPVEEAGILIADLERDRFDRSVVGFQHLLGFLEAYRVHIFQR